MNKYRLDTPLRLSHFFAQIRQEVGLSLKTEENFTYSVSGLKTN
jgi:predicted chitinase